MISPDYLLAIDIYYYISQDTMKDKKITKELKRQQ